MFFSLSMTNLNLLKQEITKKISGPLKNSFQGIQGVSNSEMGTKNACGDHSVSNNAQNAAVTAHGSQIKVQRT